jgi:2-oxoglutarate/2-oxoacid ferredoxin oxidoreductase subunit alpha
VVARYPRVLVPELNLGQLVQLIRAKFLVDAKSLNKVQGLPLRAAEVDQAIEAMIVGEL